MAQVWKTRRTKELWDAVLTLKNPAEAAAFFRDLLTIPEILEFANRWRAARMLNDGISYTAITAETGLSSRTVARIARWLNRGQGGYRLAIARQHHRRPVRLRQS